MINQDISTGDFKLELNDCCSTRRHGGCLDVCQSGRGQRSLLIDSIEDLTDDMERRGKVWTAYAEEDTYRFANFGLERLLFCQSANSSVEDQILWIFIEQCLLVLTEKTCGTICFIGIDFTLHYIELTVNRGQTFFRFHQDHSIHAVGDMLGNHRGRAVVNEQTGVQCLGGKHCLFAGSRLGHRGATTGTSDCMEVHGMCHGAIRQVFEMNLNRITHTHTIEWTRYLAIECPVFIGCSVRELAFDFNGFEINAHGLWFADAHLGLSRHFCGITNNIRTCGGRVIDNDSTTYYSTAVHWCRYGSCVARCIS